MTDDLQEDYFIPKSINASMSGMLFADLPESVRAIAKQLRDSGWKFYIVSQSRGRCYYRSKVITIPDWAIQKGLDYKTWYVSHEMAHTFARGDQHGMIFMSHLKRICPTECQHFELGYKPRNAVAAGIRKPKSLSLANATDAL